MKFALILLFITISSHIIAQPYGVWELQSSYGYVPFRNVYAVFKIEDAVIVIAEGYSGDYPPYSPCFIKIDQKGNVILYKEYNSMYKTRITSAVQSSDSTITIFGIDIHGTSHLTTIAFNGYILNQKRFENTSALKMGNGDILFQKWTDTTLIWTCKSVDGDTLWSKILFKDYSNLGFDKAARLDNQEIIITGSTSGGARKGFISKFSAEGDSLWFKVLEGRESQINALEFNKGEIIVGGMMKPDSLNKTKNFISIIDNNGFTIKTKVWGEGDFNTVADLKILTDGSYVIGGELTDGTYRKAYIGKINSNLEFNWLYIDPKINNADYGSPHIYNRGKICQSVLQIDSSNYIFAGNYHATHSPGGLKLEGGFISKLSFDVTSVDVVNKENFKYLLKQNYPNPFNPTTAIRYQIPEAGFVLLTVYDMLGKEVASLVNEEKTAGEYIAEFNASNLSSGVYLYRLQTGSFIETKKLMLMK